MPRTSVPITQGRGYYSMEYGHYEPVPANLEPRVIEEAKRLRDEDE